MSSRTAVLLTNGGHINLPGNRELIEDIFIRQAGLDVEVIHDPNDVTREKLERPDLLLDYSGDPKILATDEQLDALMRDSSRAPRHERLQTKAWRVARRTRARLEQRKPADALDSA